MILEKEIDLPMKKINEIHAQNPGVPLIYLKENNWYP